MPRQRYCRKCGEFHDLDEPWPHEPERRAVSEFPTPYFVKDDLGMRGVLNHADGKRYDSRSAYYKAVKAAGCEIVGDKTDSTPFAPTKSRSAGADIKSAIEQLTAKANS